MSEKITLTEVRKDGTKVESISISREDLNIGVKALSELRRNNMGLVTYGQIKKLEDYIKRTGKMVASAKFFQSFHLTFSDNRDSIDL